MATLFQTDLFAIKFCTDSHGAQRMNPKNFSNPLSLHHTTMRFTFMVLSEMSMSIGWIATKLSTLSRSHHDELITLVMPQLSS